MSFPARLLAFLCASVLPLAAQLIHYRAKVDPGIPSFRPGTTISEMVTAVGSDPLAQLCDEWDIGFRKFNPSAHLKFTPSTTPPAVKAFVEGAVDLAFLAREMTPPELKAFEAKHGYAPVRIPLCIDATIVFVNRSNPLKKISMGELDAIYGTKRLGGAKEDLRTWGELGLKGDWKGRTISPYSREKATAIAQLFREQVLLKGEAKPTIVECADANSVAEAVITDAGAIGYSPIVAWYSSNRILAVIPYQSEEAVPPTQEAVIAGKYPMTRLNYLYVNRAPGVPLAPAVKEFATFVLSREGQECVADAGLFPAPPDLVKAGLKRLQ
jgi:phosphate transport system substrate-binding protein